MTMARNSSRPRLQPSTLRRIVPSSPSSRTAAAANSSGGVLGKMLSPQNLTIAAAAVRLEGEEGTILRKVLGWSLGLLLLLAILIALQATPVLGWMLV